MLNNQFTSNEKILISTLIDWEQRERDTERMKERVKERE